MNTKLLGIALMFMLAINPVMAQDEALLIEEEPPPSDDLFGGDFFSDLDSFLEEESDEIMVPESLTEETLEPISSESSTSEQFQSSSLTPTTSAGQLPSTATVTLSVINTSQDNADATQSGVRPGDVLRYEVMLESPTEDVVNFVPTINVSGIESVVEFTNTGFGVRENSQIVYPAYSHAAPCTQAFTFFVRINQDCADMTNIVVTSPEGGTVTVPLNCGLAQTGPSQTFYLLSGLFMIVLAVAFSIFGRRQTS